MMMMMMMMMMLMMLLMLLMMMLLMMILTMMLMLMMLMMMMMMMMMMMLEHVAFTFHNKIPPLKVACVQTGCSREACGCATAPGATLSQVPFKEI